MGGGSLWVAPHSLIRIFNQARTRMSTSAHPDVFPLLAIRDKFKVVGGSNLAAKTVVELATGRNTESSAVDGVSNGSFFPGYVHAASLSSYPAANKSGLAAVTVPFLGVLEEATNDDKYGLVTFRGAVKINVVPINGGSAATFRRGALVILDASNSYAVSVVDAAADTAAGDIIIGKLLEDYTTAASASAVEMFVWWDAFTAHTRIA